MFPQILCDVAHYQQISIICQPPGKLRSREMLSEKRASEGANDERYGINISVCWTVWLHRSDHEKPPNPCIVNYYYQHLWLTAPSCWTDLTAGRAHAVLCPLKKAWHFPFWTFALRNSSPNNWKFSSWNTKVDKYWSWLLFLFQSQQIETQIFRKKKNYHKRKVVSSTNDFTIVQYFIIKV